MPNALAVEERLRRLLEANRLVVSHLDLSSVLRQIIEAARDLAGAAYVAIVTLGPDGRMEEFLHVGMDETTVDGIGNLPVGLGLLGVLIDDPRPVRLARLSNDERSVGLPDHHPEMSSFLGVPLRVRDEIFGHLYLADPRVDVFTAGDQEVVEALAATAGVAIAHARLFEESKRREEWTAASSRINHELLTNADVDALELIAERVLELAGADLVGVVLPRDPHPPGADLLLHHVVGARRAGLTGNLLPPGPTLVARCLQMRMPQMVEDAGVSTPMLDLPEMCLGPAMAVPLLTVSGVRGALLMVRDRGRPLFTEFELDVAASFAGQAALALERNDARVARARTRTLEDHDRIARDLHDHVVQRLFAVGLNMQSVSSALGPGAASDRLEVQIDEIDATIRQVRTTIFGLNRVQARPLGIRAQLLTAISAAAVALPRPPDVDFTGPVDLVVPAVMTDDLVAVVREGLTNVVRHAGAQRVEVRVSVDPHRASIEILDDGCGGVDGSRSSGLGNLEKRAASWGGAFEVGDGDTGGTRLCWSVPLPPSPR